MAKSRFVLREWRGKMVDQAFRDACADGINQVLADAVTEAKNSHGGWKNVTGRAEGSIQVLETATAARLVGRWGSRGVIYMRRLEFEHGGALRSAADKTYQELTSYIQRNYAWRSA